MWDQRYAVDEYVYGKEPNDFLAEVSGGLAPGKVLCLAEGEGRNAVFLAALGHAVTAVDASAVGLEKARKLATERGVEIAVRVADLADFAIAPQHWDGVVAIFCHLPPDLRRLVHRRIVTGLRPGGRFILEAYTPRQLQFKTGGPPTAELLVTLADLQAELNGLDFEIAEEVERDIHEGHSHFGRGAVVRVVARKP